MSQSRLRQKFPRIPLGRTDFRRHDPYLIDTYYFLGYADIIAIWRPFCSIRRRTGETEGRKRP